MRALALEGVHVERKCGDKRLALARAHLGDVAAVQRDGAGELHVVGALADVAVDGLAGDGERLREHVVQRLAVAQARAEAIGAFTQRLVAERADLRLEVVDLPDQRRDLLERALVGVADQLPQNAEGHAVSSGADQRNKSLIEPPVWMRCIASPNSGATESTFVGA